MKIFLIGAGKSTSYLIDYLLDNAAANDWWLRVGDIDVHAAEAKIRNHPRGEAVSFEVQNADLRRELISGSDMVISMLPATMHGDVARDCLQFGKHLITASYVSQEMRNLHSEAKEKGLVFLNEAGLDPGIDHASAMKIIDEIHEAGGKIESFKSFCGGLVAPESNDNPWGYKFSWNPRNVTLAGQGTAQYLDKGELKFIPYQRIFSQTETIQIDGLGSFDAYANRDSISYREPYGLKDVKTLLRGTLRSMGYCRAWNVFVQLGLTDDSWKLPDWGVISWPQLLRAFLPGEISVKDELIKLCRISGDAETILKLEWLGIFEEENTVHASGKTPAQLLQQLLESKWKLNPHDKDMIVMQHMFEWVNSNGKRKKISSSLAVIGKDNVYTAMAKTVGLPLAICARLVAQKKINQAGVLIPVTKEIYLPLLKELSDNEIHFYEKTE